MKCFTFTATFLLIAIFLSIGLAQETKEKKDVKQSAPLTVQLNVSVTDSAGRPINNLNQGQFRVLEDDVPQAVSFFAHHEGLLACVLAVDNSGSLRTQFQTVIDAAKELVASTQSDAKVLLMRFVSHDKIQTLVHFTSDRRALTNELDGMYIEGGLSAIVDAVFFGNEQIANYVKGDEKARRSLVLITDGEDRNSYYKQDQLFAKLRETGLQVFVIGLVRELNTKRGRERAVSFLNRLAQETGGNVYYPESVSDVERDVKLIIVEMNAPYVVGYESTNSARDGAFRKVWVEVVNQPAGVKLTAIARDGYAAPKN